MSGYIGPVPVPQATQTREAFTATSGQTTFNTGGYTAGYIDVFLNGVKLVDTTDYQATNGSDVVLTSGAATGDILETVAYTAFTVADQDFTGTTTTEDLTVTGAFTSQGIDDNATSTAMTLATDGSLQVNTTSSLDHTATSGASSFAHNVTSGYTVVARDTTSGNAAMYINKQNALGGPAIGLYENGVRAGDIGVAAGDMYLGTGDTNLRFHDGDNKIYPAAALGGSTDGVTDLGFETGKWNTTWTKNLRVQNSDIGAGLSSYGSVAFEDVDAHVDISSDSSGTWGSTINLREYNTSGTYLNSWSIARHSTSGGTGRLNFNYGTENNHNINSIKSYLTTDGKLWTAGGVYLGGQSSSNLLEDYEEGSWTVTAGSNFGTLANRVGKYVKIGQMVYVKCYFSFSGASTTTSRNLSGLPFAAVDDFSLSSVEGSLSYWGDVQSIAYVEGTTIVCSVNSADLVFGGTVASSGNVRLHGWYRTTA